ncbi:MAG: hypothetical protein ABSD88_09260 [Candidatus Korobacteraceae bacterium]|jgi:hypothetical protein
MHPESVKKIWINPWKYWAITSTMSSEETNSLMSEVLHYAESGNAEALKHYDFVELEDPVLAWRDRRRSVV